MFGVSGTGDTPGYGRLIRTLSLPAVRWDHELSCSPA
ncbi:hypothetical protein ABIA39_001602 [Nocardia sp. GAS34]